MTRTVYIVGTQEVQADLVQYSVASLAIYIIYANLGQTLCNAPTLPCMLTVKQLCSSNSHTQYICANYDTALYRHLPLGRYKITLNIANNTYCTTYTLTNNNRIALHALPLYNTANSCSFTCI